jgi:hypothetical protein
MTVHPCGFVALKGFEGVLFHEARHAYQFTQSSLVDAQGQFYNDQDQDYLVNTISVPADDSVPPGDYFLDTTTPRLVCNTDLDSIGLGNLGQIQASFLGPLIKDVFEPLVGYALDMDAYTFAAYWAK